MARFLRRPGTCLFFSLVAGPAAAQTSSVVQSPTDIEALDLDELLSTPVTTATLTQIAANEAPALVDVVTHEEIRQRGYRHLGDVLGDLRDNHEDRANWGIGEPLTQNVGFGFRFDTGQNILLLFNGQRLNAFLPGNRFGAEEYLLDNVDRIEIIRGPGSSLYGANAFTCVVNVISKSRLDAGERPYLRGSLGTLPSSAGAVATASFKAIPGSAFLSGSVRLSTEGGEALRIENSLFGDATVEDAVRRALDGDMFFSRGAFRAYGRFQHQERNTVTGFNGVSPDEMKELRLMGFAHALGADYTARLGERLTLRASVGGHVDNWTEVALIPLFKLNATGDGLERDADGNPILDSVPVTRDGRTFDTSFVIDGQGADTVTLETDVHATWNYRARNQVVLGVGVSWDRILGARRPTELALDPPAVVPFQTFDDEANNWLFDPDASRLGFGTYGQIDFDAGEHVTLTGGGRLDAFHTSGHDHTEMAFSPRAGAVFRAGVAGRAKVLYGRALRVPNGFEQLSKVAILGSQENEPETIDTVQVAWEKTWRGVVTAEIGGFHSRITDHLITDANLTELQRAQGFVGRFVNLDEVVSATGVDGRFLARFAGALFQVNFTRQVASDDGTGADIGYVPRTMVNANLSFPVRFLNVSLTANHRSDFSQPGDDPRPSVDGYTLLGGTLLYRLPETPVEIRFGGRNLLGEDVRHPSSSRDFPRHFPGRGPEVWMDVAVTRSF